MCRFTFHIELLGCYNFHTVVALLLTVPTSLHTVLLNLCSVTSLSTYALSVMMSCTSPIFNAANNIGDLFAPVGRQGDLFHQERVTPRWLILPSALEYVLTGFLEVLSRTVLFGVGH